MVNVYNKSIIEFVTVAAEYCLLLENSQEYTRSTFVDRSLKLLPLLYLKGQLLPIDIEVDNEEEILELFVTEAYYGQIVQEIGTLLGETDDYLDTFHPDFHLSDTPILCHISEQMADIYQTLKDTLGTYAGGVEPLMRQAIGQCRALFAEQWGQAALNALRALHSTEANEANISNQQPWE